jgi:prepilin-type processing-associated H-X9-DG protein
VPFAYGGRTERSQTMALAETARGPGPGSADGPRSVRGVEPATQPCIGGGRPFGGYYPGGANVALADGSIRFIRDTVDPRVFEALSTIAGG